MCNDTYDQDRSILKVKLMMPRIREFDPDKALDKALQLFWHKGYAETSMRDVVAATGVAHAGLYSAFGGKRQLYQAALERHLNVNMTHLLSSLTTPDAGRTELEQFFEMMLTIVRTGNFEDGCFMANTAVAFGTEPSDILDIFNDHIERMESGFRSALENAKARGEVCANLNSVAVADLLVTVFNGMAVLARGGAGYGRIKRSVRTALSILD
ncbi:MAG: TetR/AcrR family transcriptional regulator [Anaerolineae bacterium]